MPRRLLAIALVLLLAACGGAPPPGPAPGPPPTAGRLVPPNFGDADPHPWNGRAPQTCPVHGIDASRWQGMIDWPTARANGVNFAFLKATEGGDLVDPLWRANRAAARAAGVPVGGYHFWYHCRPAAEQARWFIANVPRGGLPPVLDMEWTPFSPTCRLRPPPAAVRAEAQVFLRLLEAHYGQRPIIYSPVDFYRDNEMWKVGPYEFWLRSVAGHPQDVFGGRHWTFWQYTSTGLVPGIAGKVDINVFEGSEADWARWLAARAR
ncbi:MAG TPA: GH25 family lysozyme [Paracoccaceae bacterium]|nr:GH25 family lysozyme [Paracoccaceae bacterium]HMO71800.1 GH25 family lysozyme [Paracoccaceae bacterium]